MSEPALSTHPETPQDAAAAEALIASIFGPGQLAKSSERVREFAQYLPECSFCVRRGDELVGLVRLWRVAVGGTPIAFLGPLAFKPALRGAGYGVALLERACEAAQAAGYPAVLLVGDEPYYSRAGFSAEAGKAVVMPGPVDQGRVLVRVLDPAMPPLCGPVQPA